MAKPESAGTGPSGQVDPDRGRTGKYTVLMELGSGASATVSAAVSSGIAGFSKVVVLKSIRDGLGRDESTIKMFSSEARILARMNHPNIVQVYEVFKQNNLPVIVMEYLDGEPLATLLARCDPAVDLSPEIGSAILIKTLAALHYAHSLVDYSGEPLHLVHRDVSPQNVMIGYDGQIKLVDFGIAKLKSQSVQTRTGVIKGKLCYMAPEQVQNRADHRADIFAVGVMLWEILAGQRMWGDAGDAAIISRLLREDIPRLRDVAPYVDPELERICSKALAPDREQRYAHAADMQSDLEAYLERNPVDVSQEAIGKLLERTCGDLRAQTSATLERKIMALGMSVTGEYDASDGNDLGHSAVVALHPARAGRNPLAVIVAFGALAVATLALLLRAPRAAEPAATAEAAAPIFVSAPAPSPPPASPSPAPPESVTLNVSVMPLHARLYLDGRRLASNPCRESLPRDSFEHTFLAQAEGFEEFEKVIRLAADLDMTVALQAEVASSTSSAVNASRSRQRTAPREASSAPPEVTDPPGAAERSAMPAAEPPLAAPETLAPGEDLRATRRRGERQVQFDDPYDKR